VKLKPIQAQDSGDKVDVVQKIKELDQKYSWIMKFFFLKEAIKEEKMADPMIIYKLNFDGSSRKNFGGIGGVITDPVKN
jgi:hypothetical protein